MSERLRKALHQVGGEPLVASDFENETPDPEFSDTEPCRSRASALMRSECGPGACVRSRFSM